MHKVVVIGGGAAGFFSAIAAAGQSEVILLEKSAKVLSKVRISGGGRCNVTHACFDTAILVQNYPRGGKELKGPFSRFQPQDTIAWFESRGVPLKTEPDGRMFPATNSSETIIECLTRESARLGVKVRTQCEVVDFFPENSSWKVILKNGEELLCGRLLATTGSSGPVWDILERLGHSIMPPVPSLFTFNVPQSPLLDLAGISLAYARVEIPEAKLSSTGPLLLTHWGFSGPAILKLSAWGARSLHALGYQASLTINWLPEVPTRELFQQWKHEHGSKPLAASFPVPLPKNLWKRLLELLAFPTEQKWATLSKAQLEKLLEKLHADRYLIEGKTTNKEEFVTCGGVALSEVNFKTMESKKLPGLFFAGEVLDIDGLTGGFNFQNAWTTAWIAGNAASCDESGNKAAKERPR